MPDAGCRKAGLCNSNATARALDRGDLLTRLTVFVNCLSMLGQKQIVNLLTGYHSL